MSKKTGQQFFPLSGADAANREKAKDRGEIQCLVTRLAKLFSPAIPSEVLVSYWRFAARRQEVFFNRFNGLPPPWTNDDVISHHRFTNVYRAADRVTQYLIRHVQYNANWSSDDLFFRTILFKTFNRIETWKKFLDHFGEPTLASFSPDRFGKALSAAMSEGGRIYSAAYIMPSGGSKSGFKRKHDMHLNLIARMIKEGLPKKVREARTLGEVFTHLRAYPTIGDFLAYQYAIDLNYSRILRFSENDFVVAGPGAKEGISKCFTDLGGMGLDSIINKVRLVQEDAFAELGIRFQSLWGRPLHLIDCQNLFCEVAKYARVFHPEFNGPDGRVRIKQKFIAETEPIKYMFPPRWGLVVPDIT